jgi:hypothetical protein
MNLPPPRILHPRWRTLVNAGLAIAAVAVIGFTTIMPTKADDDDWQHRRGWQERQCRDDNLALPPQGVARSSSVDGLLI